MQPLGTHGHIMRVQRAMELAEPSKPEPLLADALLEVALAAALCAAEADMDSSLTISPRTWRRPP
eukprot:scaffold10728_cov64-Phaeocystis_antarctica.AAC.6